MIFKRKTRHKSTKHGEITSGSRDGSRTPTCSSMWQHYRKASALYNDNLKKFYTHPTTLRPNGTNVLSFRIHKNSLLAGSEGSVLSINLISQSYDGSDSENVDRSNFVWEYHLLMQCFVNICNCSNNCSTVDPTYCKPHTLQEIR